MMKIIWTNCERFDRNLDKATWIEMTKELLKKGHLFYLIVPSSGNRDNFGLGKNIVYLPTMPWRGLFSLGFSLTLFLYLMAITLLDTPHVILLGFKTFFPLVPFMLLSKLRLIKTKFVLDIRSIPVEVHDPIERIMERVHQWVISLANLFLDGVTVISPLMKKQICDKYSIDESNVRIWSSGVSLETFNLEAIDPMNEPHFWNKGLVVMYHGTLSKTRGLQETVKAINLLKGRYPDIVFVMLGEGKARGELESLIKELNLEENVFLHKPVPYENVPKYIAYCDIGILPFPNLNWWRVSSPLKLMEYLAMGKSVIVTNIEAHREVLNNSSCGIFIKSHEPEEIAEGIEKAYHLRNKLRKMGKIGRELVIRKYTWEKQAENLINFLESL
jgi:glycosyltransferase involved in cell wall biosynthesis